MSDRATLCHQIEFTDLMRPWVRAAASVLLLVPVLHLGLETRADRALLGILGVACGGFLVYAAGKYRRIRGILDDHERADLLSFLWSGLAVLGAIFALIGMLGDQEWATWATVAVLLAAVAVAGWVVSLVRPRDNRQAPAPQRSGYSESMGATPSFAGTMIACSGGGIRAAAFCLGGLQRLRTPTAPGQQSVYDGSARVLAVSGGAYIATALHLARRHSPTIEAGQPALFAPGSPEEDWLRRRSKFLLPSGSIVPGVLSLLYGIAVNLALLGIVLYLAAWYVGWLHSRLGGLCGTDGDSVVTATCLGDGSVASWSLGSPWLKGALLVLLLGLLWFAASKTLSKYLPRGRLAAPEVTRNLVTVGAGLLVLGVLAPWLLTNLNNATLAGEPTGVVAKAMSAARLATPDACEAAVVDSLQTSASRAWGRTLERDDPISFSYGACGETWTDDARVFAPEGQAVSVPENGFCESEEGPTPSYCDDRSEGGISGWERFGAWAAALAALATAVRGLAKGLGGGGGGAGTASRLSSLTASLRRTVLPWTAFVVLGIVLVVVLLVMARDNMVDPDRLDSVPGVIWALAVFVALRFLTDAILSSLHPFYRERLSDTFLIKRRDDQAVALDYKVPTHLHESHVADGPDLTVCCAVNITDRDYVPAARGCASFLFETTAAGGRIGISDARLPDGRMSDAQAYSATSDPQGIDTTLAAAMATSGAAFSPLAGRQSGRIRPYRVLLALVNARLGVWLPNPYQVDAGATVAAAGVPASASTWWKWTRIRALRPGPFRLFKEAFGALSIYDQRVYVTDGGHYDNTGIVEALRWRPRRLVVLDASADPRDSLDALGDAIVTARMDLGLVIAPVDAEELSQVKGHVDPGTSQYVRPERGWMHLVVTTVEDPTTPLCDIWFVKNVLPLQPNIGLETYAAENPGFPLTTTVNQFYGEYDFEAYRLLGYTNTTAMMTAMLSPGVTPPPPPPAADALQAV